MCLKDITSGVTHVHEATFEQVSKLIAGATGKQPAKTSGMTAKIEQDMLGPMSEMFFANVRILVEGLEDIAFISSYLTLMDKWNEFRALGCHLVQVQGKSNLIDALAIAKQMKLPTYVIYDSDGDTPPDTPERKTGNRNKHEKDNSAIQKLMEVSAVTPFPDATFWVPGLTAWKNTISDMLKEEIGSADYHRICEETKAKYNMFVSDLDKNSLFLGYFMEEAWNQGKRSNTLKKLCEELLNFGKQFAVQKVEQATAAAASGTAVGHEKVGSLFS